MYKIERQEKILDYINKKERASIAELSELFHVSKVTMRSDVDELEGKGLVNKTHGGVVSKDIGISSEIPYEIKNQSKIKEKQRIAKAALQYVKKKDVIIIDSGSTTFRLVEGLPDEITVITTDILLAVEIIKSKKDIRIVMPGGEVDKTVYTLEGIDTIRFFESLHADKVFLGCDALDFEIGLSDRSREYAAIKQAMIKASAQVILLTDSSKFHSKLMSKVCPLEQLDVLIVDKIDSELEDKCQSAGIQVVTAK
ncbi:MAG: DeoR/GlpR transcriptional regulator [Clostridiales bacterium]|nr:DeoR/GlpR transcriptional regulator [Clostridiales bacterium]